MTAINNIPLKEEEVSVSVHTRFTEAAIIWEERGWGTIQLRATMREGVEVTWKQHAQQGRTYIALKVEEGWQSKNKEWKPQQTQAVNEWVAEGLRLHYIEVSPHKPLGLNAIFAVPKSTAGEWRIITDMRPLNRQLEDLPFHMEGSQEILEQIYSGCWMCSFDIKSAFNHLTIAPHHRTYFGFELGGTYYVHRAMPFGYSQAPYWWDQVSKTISRALREMGLRCVLYVDDGLIISPTQEECQSALRQTLLMLETMGVTVNVKKVQQPTQDITFMGYEISTHHQPSFTINIKKRKKIRGIAASILRAQYTTRKRIAQLVGVIQGARLALQSMHVMTADLMQWTATLAQHNVTWGEHVGINSLCLKELTYWARVHKWQSVMTYPHRYMPVAVVETDASSKYWGLVVQEGHNIQLAQYPWLPHESTKHATYLETLAASRALEILSQRFSNSYVVWRTDNMAARAALKKGRSVAHNLLPIARNMAITIARSHLHLMLSHLPGRLNTLADIMSRKDNPQLSWADISVESPQEPWMREVMEAYMGDTMTTRDLPRDLMTCWQGSMSWCIATIMYIPQLVHKLEEMMSSMSPNTCIMVVVPAWRDRWWYWSLKHMAVWEHGWRAPQVPGPQQEGSWITQYHYHSTVFMITHPHWRPQHSLYLHSALTTALDDCYYRELMGPQ